MLVPLRQRMLAGAVVLTMMPGAVFGSVVIDCVSDTGARYVGSSQHVRDISIYYTLSELYLTHYKKGRMVEIKELGDIPIDGLAEDLWPTYQTLIMRYIAQRRGWSFDEVVSYAQTRGFSAQKTSIVADGCICEKG
ncbi:MAG: hypothetical protein MK098_08285 [Marinovum sp.]|nr:hypothetical protein [Marinovum sp.]